MSRERQYPTTPESKPKGKQFTVTGGGVITPVEGLSSDAGLGKPPAPGEYGAQPSGEFPSSGKVPGGNAKAMSAYFGKGKRGTP